ncbi:MAG TPA: PepSY-associated TM helix domain-containing protein [Candidatus Binataceae bacterium]
MNLMSLRPVLLRIHLFLGILGGLFFVIIGLTGAVIAFENDLDHWAHPGLSYIEPGSKVLAEQDLIDGINRAQTPAHATAVQHFRDPRLVRAIRMSNGATVLASPYDGHITGQFKEPSDLARYIGYIHQLHLRLVPDPRTARQAAGIGEYIVLAVGYLACITIPTGLSLWWRAKRKSIRFSQSTFRLMFDTHNTIGIWLGALVFITAATGVMVEQEPVYFAIAGSGRPGPIPKITSIPGATPVTADSAIGAASAALRGSTVQVLQLPASPDGVFTAVMRFPEDSSEAAHSTVLVDQYTGQVRFSRNFLTDSPGFRLIRFNRAIHTGDALGTAGHVIMSLASLAMVVLTVSGWIVWLKRTR